MASIIIAAIFLVWLVAAWAMIMMVIAALKDRERRHLGWFLGGSFLMTSYNRRYLWIFATCVGVGTAVVAAFNALLLTRHITL
jgi:hypothetical protein